jgi:hypothetical protein
MSLGLTLHYFEARQPHISRQWFGWRRLQQLGEKLQDNEADEQHGSSFGGKLPANAESHAASKGSARQVRPPLYATASRNSAMSFNCSSTQSPGLRE